jgi:hypothetical protein
MSDNIDYAELDKAVNEALKSRSATKSRATKPAAKPAAPMHSHGQFMDFVRVQPHHVSHPAPVSAKPITRPATPVAPRPIMAPAAPKVTTAPRPAILPRSAKVGAAVKPMRPSVSAQIQQKQQAVTTKPIAKPAAKPAVKPVAKPIAKAEPKPVAKPVAKVEEKPVKLAKKPEVKHSAPNANNYSLGVRSPFMTNTKVEKRPLGKDIPETSTTSLRSTKNIYSSKSPSKSSAKVVKKKHMVTEAPKKHSGWLWTLVVLLVIAAGAGLGYLAYLLVFTNQL